MASIAWKTRTTNLHDCLACAVRVVTASCRFHGPPPRQSMSLTQNQAARAMGEWTSTFKAVRALYCDAGSVGNPCRHHVEDLRKLAGGKKGRAEDRKVVRTFLKATERVDTLREGFERRPSSSDDMVEPLVSGPSIARDLITILDHAGSEPDNAQKNEGEHNVDDDIAKVGGGSQDEISQKARMPWVHVASKARDVSAHMTVRMPAFWQLAWELAEYQWFMIGSPSRQWMPWMAVGLIFLSVGMLVVSMALDDKVPKVCGWSKAHGD